MIPIKVNKIIKPAPKITKTQIKLSAYNHTNISIIGKCTVTLRNKKANITAQLVIAKTNSNAVITADTANKKNINGRKNDHNRPIKTVG